MKKASVANLPLHYGKAPRWLTSRMTKLAHEMTTIIINEYGQSEFLLRISDTHWFQALGCVLGYDWHSSGVTTVLTGVLKNAIKPDMHGLAVCGGKGKASRNAPKEIAEMGENFGFSAARIDSLQHASRISAKVDNALIQAGYPLYHHAFFLAENGDWAVVQQGMSVQDRTARRYHWLSDNLTNYIEEPHNAIVGDSIRPKTLDMTAKQSDQCRKTSVGIAKERPNKVVKMLESIRPTHQKSLQEWIPAAKWKTYAIDVLSMPRNVNWNTLKRIYEFQPQNYEELLDIKGVGSSTIRGLALISEIIYGNAPSWKDPVKYSFAYGGKNGVPYSVDRKAMDESIEILKHMVESAKIGDKEKMQALRRLEQLVT